MRHRTRTGFLVLFGSMGLIFLGGCTTSDPAQVVATQSETDAEADAEAEAPTETESAAEVETATEAPAEPVVLTFNTWQSSDWWEPVAAAFTRDHPGITIELNASESSEYDEDIEEWIINDALGDIVACRGFDWALDYYNKGVFSSLSDIDGMERFSPLDTAAWTTDDGDETFCVPVAAVNHAFAYNKNILDELGIEVPKTDSEFQAALETVAADGRYVPFSIGLDPPGAAASMVWFVTGPQYWQGEQGRLGLISRSAKLTDEPFVESLRQLEAWAPTFPSNPSQVARIDGIDAFANGTAAFMPVGSWEAGWLRVVEHFEVGIMAAPSGPSGQCYSVEHTDIGLALNANSENLAAAEQFITWVTTREFAEAFFTESSGFFSLQRDAPEPLNPMLVEFLEASEGCEPTERLSVQMLSRNEHDLTSASGEIVTAVLSGELSAEDAAQQLQDALEQGYGASAN